MTHEEQVSTLEVCTAQHIHSFQRAPGTRQASCTHTHTHVTLGLWVWMNQGCGDLALHHAIFYLMFRPAPPLDMCKLKGKLAKRLDHELMFSSQYGNCALRQKGDKQVQHFL